MEAEEREDGVLQCVAKLQRFSAHEWNGTRFTAVEFVLSVQLTLLVHTPTPIV